LRSFSYSSFRENASLLGQYSLKPFETVSFLLEKINN
jgi:hypothetical protein